MSSRAGSPARPAPASQTIKICIKNVFVIGFHCIEDGFNHLQKVYFLKGEKK
jgi:hypothetical protein